MINEDKKTSLIETVVVLPLVTLDNLAQRGWFPRMNRRLMYMGKVFCETVGESDKDFTGLGFLG
jgi:hypothetical protein